MKHKGKLIVAVILIVTVAVSGFSGCANQQPDTYIQAMDTELSHFDLLFHKHGSVSFRHHGEDIHLYLAQYRRDERVLHERVGGLGIVGEYTFEGTIL